MEAFFLTNNMDTSKTLVDDEADRSQIFEMRFKYENENEVMIKVCFLDVIFCAAKSFQLKIGKLVKHTAKFVRYKGKETVFF